MYSSLLKKHQEITETADHLKLENATLQIEKGLVESSWESFITNLRDIDSMEALDEFKYKHSIL